jgi:hypothetical protein
MIFALSFFLFQECLVSCLCDSFAVSFGLNSDSPDKAQQLSPHRSDDFLLLLASCALRCGNAYAAGVALSKRFL